jgi:hypothetical protein
MMSRPFTVQDLFEVDWTLVFLRILVEYFSHIFSQITFNCVVKLQKAIVLFFNKKKDRNKVMLFSLLSALTNVHGELHYILYKIKIENQKPTVLCLMYIEGTLFYSEKSRKD